MQKSSLISLAAITAGSFLQPVLVQGSVIAVWENDHLSGTEVSTTAGESPSAGSFNPGLASAPVLSRGIGATAAPYANSFGFQVMG